MPGLGQQGAACLPRHCADVDLRREFEHKLPRAFKPFNATKVSILKRGRGLTLTLTPTLTLTLTPTLTLTLTLEGEQLGARGGALSATPGLLAPIRGVSDEVVAVRIRLHFSTINSRIRLLEAKALAQASRELSGDFDFSLVGRRLDSYHSPPNVAVTEAAGRGQPPISTAARDAFLAHSCERLQRHGFSATHLPPKLREWLRGVGGRQFIKEQRTILQGLEASDTHAREMAWLVRVVQIQLREKAPQVLLEDVGADELTPLLEQVVVATQLQHGWQVRAKLQVLDGHTLLHQPDLAAAVDGWEVALAGVEGQAIDCWRRASYEAAFWSAVVAHARPRPPACASLRGDAGAGWTWLLADCATPPWLPPGLLLRRVAEEEVVAWNFAPPGRYLEVHDAFTLPPAPTPTLTLA